MMEKCYHRMEVHSNEGEIIAKNLRVLFPGGIYSSSQMRDGYEVKYRIIGKSLLLRENLTAHFGGCSRGRVGELKIKGAH